MALRQLLSRGRLIHSSGFTALEQVLGTPAAWAMPSCLQLFRRPSSSAAAPAVPTPAAAAALAAAGASGFGTRQPLSVPVYDLSRQQVGTYELPGDVFNVPVRTDILHRVVRWQLAKRQQGTHKAKGRAEVRGGGRKPWNQKGSGRARQGSIRAPQWRGGGAVFGPVPRSHEHSLQKRVRRLGLACALSAKARESRLLLVDSLAPAEAKTSAMDGHLEQLLAGAPRRSALLVDSDVQGEDGGEGLRRSIANLPWVDPLPARGLNVYSILQRDYLLMTTAAADAVVARLRRPLRPQFLAAEGSPAAAAAAAAERA